MSLSTVTYSLPHSKVNYLPIRTCIHTDIQTDMHAHAHTCVCITQIHIPVIVQHMPMLWSSRYVEPDLLGSEYTGDYAFCLAYILCIRQVQRTRTHIRINHTCTSVLKSVAVAIRSPL